MSFLLRLILTLLCTGVCLYSRTSRAEDINCGLLDFESHQGWPLQTPLLYQGWVDTLEYRTVGANMNCAFLCLKVMLTEQRSNVCHPLLLEWFHCLQTPEKKSCLHNVTKSKILKMFSLCGWLFFFRLYMVLVSIYLLQNWDETGWLCDVVGPGVHLWIWFHPSGRSWQTPNRTCSFREALLTKALQHNIFSDYTISHRNHPFQSLASWYVCACVCACMCTV